MPRLEDIIKESDKKKLLMHKKEINFVGDSDPIQGKLKPQVIQTFVGQTPNLNSSLGINAADGLPTNTGIAGGTPAVTQSKTDVFFQKNQNVISGLGSTLLGALTGNSGSSSTTISNDSYQSPPPITPSKKILGMPQWLFIATIILLVIIIGIVIYKKTRK